MHTNIEPTSIVSPTRIAGRPAMSAGDGRPAYRYVGDGRWLPSNQAALDECAAWNTFADRWNARTSTRSAVQ